VDEGIELVQLGCRIWKPEEQEFAKSRKIKETLDGLKGPVYVTVDLDVLDPCIAPDVGTPEPEGVALQQVWAWLRQIFERGNVVGMDVVECASDSPYTATALAAASIIKKALAYRLTSRAP